MKNLLQRLDPKLKTKLDLISLEFDATGRLITKALESTNNVYELNFLTMSHMALFLKIDLNDFYTIFDHND